MGTSLRLVLGFVCVPASMLVMIVFMSVYDCGVLDCDDCVLVKKNKKAETLVIARDLSDI